MAVAAVILAVCIPQFSRAQNDDDENVRRPHALALQESSGVRGITEVRAVPSRVVDMSQASQVAPHSQAASAATTSTSADTAPSIVLQTLPGPFDTGYPPDPAVAASPTHIVASVNAKINIY